MEQTYDPVLDNLEPAKKREYWDAAFGLQKVDNIEPSRYLYRLADQHVNGEKSYAEVQQETRTYYNQHAANPDEHEADEVSESIYGILADEAFRFDVPTFKSYHRRLFEKLDPKIFHPGEFRTVNLTKKEPVLNGETVQYQDYGMLEESLDYDFKEEQGQDYLNMTDAEKIERLATFTARIWQVHPFYEGNTRTTAIFIEKYLRNLGYQVDNDMFAKHSREFRDALVLASYSNIPQGIKADHSRLIDWFTSLLRK